MTTKDMTVEQLKALILDFQDEIGGMQQRANVLGNQAQALRQEIASRNKPAPLVEVTPVDTEKKD